MRHQRPGGKGQPGRGAKKKRHHIPGLNPRAAAGDVISQQDRDPRQQRVHNPGQPQQDPKRQNSRPAGQGGGKPASVLHLDQVVVQPRHRCLGRGGQRQRAMGEGLRLKEIGDLILHMRHPFEGEPAHRKARHHRNHRRKHRHCPRRPVHRGRHLHHQDHHPKMQRQKRAARDHMGQVIRQRAVGQVAEDRHRKHRRQRKVKRDPPQTQPRPAHGDHPPRPQAQRRARDHKRLNHDQPRRQPLPRSLRTQVQRREPERLGQVKLRGPADHEDESKKAKGRRPALQREPESPERDRQHRQRPAVHPGHCHARRGQPECPRQREDRAEGRCHARKARHRHWSCRHALRGVRGVTRLPPAGRAVVSSILIRSFSITLGPPRT